MQHTTVLSPVGKLFLASLLALGLFARSLLFAGPVVIIPVTEGEIAVVNKYQSLGGSAGWLGPATGALSLAPDGVGYYQWYVNGAIYWHPTTGAHEIHGAILDRWSQLGWEQGLGYPKTDELSVRMTIRPFNEIARRSDFQWGAISWTPTYGACHLFGGIHAKWSALGKELSWLGVCVTGEEDLPGYPGDRWNKFDNGFIHWSSVTGVVETSNVPHQPANPPFPGRPGGTFGGKWPHTQGRPLVIQWAMSQIADANYGAIIRDSFLEWKRTGTIVFFQEVAYPTRFPQNFRGILVDLQVVDPNEGAVTRHSPSSTETYYQARILINKASYDRIDGFQRKKITVHEIGHALGLDHPHPLTSEATIMRQGPLDFNVPQTYDTRLINLLYPF